MKWSAYDVPSYWDDKRVCGELQLGRVMGGWYRHNRWYGWAVWGAEAAAWEARRKAWQRAMAESVWARVCRCSCALNEEGQYWMCCYCYTFELPYLPGHDD